MTTPDKSAVLPYELSPVVAHTADGGVMLNNSLIGMRTKDTEKNESTLEMTLDLNDPKAAELFPEMDITFRNRVYRIRSLDFTGNTRNGNSSIEVYAERSWYELLYSGKLAAVEFSKASIKECLEYVLRDTAWKVGKVDASDKATWKLSEGTALSGINQIGATYGLQPVFDDHAKKVLLLSNPGRDRGTTFTYDKHVTKSTRRIDTTGLITRIYGQSPDGVTISKVNGGKPYLEDYSYSKELRIAYYDFKEGIKAAEMKRLMEAYLFMRAKPVISYEFELSGLSGRQHEIERFDVFDTVFIMDKDYPSSVRSKVVGLDIDWINLDKSKISLGTELVSLARVADPSNGNAPGRISTKELPPERMPATPVEVATSSAGYWDGATPLSTITVTWPKVAASRSGKNMAIDSYEVLLSTGELISTEDNTATFEGLMINTPTVVKVRALVEGVSGYWSVPATVITKAPNEPLQAPYGISATADASIVQVRWSGNLLQNGVAVKAPARTEKVVVEQSPDKVDDWQIVGSIVHGETTLILPFKPEDVGSTYRYRMRAVDRVGVYSPYSDTVSVTIKDDFSVKLEEDLQASKDRLEAAEKQATENLNTLTAKLDDLKSQIGTTGYEGLRTELQKAKEDIEDALFDINDPSGKLAQAAAAAQKSLNQLNDKLYGEDGSLSQLSEKAQQAWNKAVAAGDKNVVEITYEYQAGSSYTKAPTGVWVADQPAVSEGDYLWRREKHTFGNGDVTIKEPYPVTGPQGADGKPGKPGKDGKVGSAGKDGTGVVDTTITYQVGSSGTTAPTGSWSNTVPSAAAGDYVWTRVLWQYTDGTSKTSYSVAKIGETGAKGDQGVSLKAITPYFMVATSAPAKPTSASPSGWQTTEPGYRSGYNLYRSDKVELSNGSYSWTAVTLVSSYQVAVKALESANGKNTINTSTATSPTKNGTTAGDVWWRVDGNGNVIAQWTWDGSSWKSNKIESDVIASLDVNKLSVATSAKMNEAVIDKLWADGINAKSVTTNRILVANNGNMLPEISSYEAGNFPNPNPYESFGHNSQHQSMWLKGRVNVYINQPLNLVAGQKYRFSYQAMASVDGTRHFISMHKGNAERKNVPAETFRNYLGNNSKTSGYIVSNEVIDRSWKTFEVEFTPEKSGFAYLFIFANHPKGTTNDNGYQWFKDVRLEKMTGATLIEDGAITTNKVKANAITADQLAANSVTADALKADAVKANHLLAEDATIDKLWANGLAAKAITASRLTVSPGNIYPDPHFEDSSWDHPYVNHISGGISLEANGTQRGAYLQPKGQQDSSMQHIPGVNYLLTANLRFGGNANITKFSVYARYKRDGGTSIAKVGEFVRFPSGQPHASYRYNDNSTVLDFSKINNMAPGGYFTLGFFVEKSESSGSVEIRDVRLTPMAGTTLIENGVVDTEKLAANAVTADKINAGAIEAKHIKSSQITSDHIDVGTIKADRIEAKVFTQVATNILPLIPGTTDPAWTAQFEFMGKETIGGVTRQVYKSSKDISHLSYENMVAVDPDIEYDFSIWVSSTSPAPKFYIELRDQDFNHAVKSGGLNDNRYPESPDAKGTARQTGTDYLVQGMTAPTSWTKYTTRIKLKEGVRFVKIGTVYPVHSSGRKGGTLMIADMQLRSHIVNQKEVDDLQNQLIKANTKNIENIRYVAPKLILMDVYSRSLQIGNDFVQVTGGLYGGIPKTQLTVKTNKYNWTGWIEANLTRNARGGKDRTEMYYVQNGRLYMSYSVDANSNISPNDSGTKEKELHNWEYIIFRIYPQL